MRLQRILAAAGVASRRKAEEIIASGRVRVNGRIVVELGSQADPEVDRVEVDGRTISAEHPITVIMNKPRGVVTTVSDPEGRPTVMEYVRGVKARLFPVGRLDYATSGALLLTNDGELAQALTHPKNGVDKTYLVKVRGKVREETLEKWREGFDLGDGATGPSRVFRVEENESFTWLVVEIREGRNRQLRRMAEQTGLDLTKLKRVSFAGVGIEGLPVGEYRELTDQELARLRKDYVLPARKTKPRAVRAGEPSPASALPCKPVRRASRTRRNT
ncbi:MAG: pseudouridine synthase [Deltaproteobacteria bacterium]|nr:pseudouridine synthase [Deltaproteobacteria bacterium]